MASLAPHQLKAIRNMRNGSILTGGVGSGKTRTALVYFYTRVVDGRVRVNGIGEWAPPKKPRDLYIITTPKKRNDLDWEKEASTLSLSTDPDSSLPGMGFKVDSWNNIGKYVAVKDAFFIFDEQRLVGSGAWVKHFYRIAKANQWVLLSATPGDTWMDYVPIFVANGFFRNKTDFTRQHVVFKPYSKFPKIDRYVNEGRLYRLRESILVDMPYERHTTRHINYMPVEYDKERYTRVTKDRWDVFNEKPLKDVSQMFVAMRRVVNEDVSRYAAIIELIQKHPRLIVFYNYDYELGYLRTLAPVLGIPVNEWNGHKHQPLPDGDSWVYAVQYTAGSEGWNCTTTDATVFWSLNYSYKVNEQSQGRIDRMNTPFEDLHYYYLTSNSPVDVAILKALRTKRDFNEREFVESWPKTQN